MSEDVPPPKHKTDGPDLSAREIRFAQLLLDYGAHGKSKAYLEAGFPPRETTNATEAAACRIVRKRQFREYLRHLQDVAAEAAKVTTEELATLVSAFAKADIRRLMTPTGEFLPMNEWPAEVAIAIESIETEEILEGVPGERGKRRLKGYTRKVKLVSKMGAAAKLMEWKRMLGQDKAVTGATAAPLTIIAGPAVIAPPRDSPDEPEGSGGR